MSKVKKPVILMDVNLLDWMAELPYTSEPKKFDLNRERAAFKELLKFREEGKIDIVLIDWQWKRFKQAKAGSHAELEKVLAFFDKKISYKELFVISDSELDKTYDELMEYIWDGLEKQDDVEFFVVSHYADSSITHVVTCDSKIGAKFGSFVNKLRKNDRLWKEVSFRKRNETVFSGLPSEVLKDLGSKGIS